MAVALSAMVKVTKVVICLRLNSISEVISNINDSVILFLYLYIIPLWVVQFFFILIFPPSQLT